MDLTQLHHVQARSTSSDPRKAHGRLARMGVARIGCAEEPSVLLLLVHAEVCSFKALGWSRCDCQALSQLQGVGWRTLTQSLDHDSRNVLGVLMGQLIIQEQLVEPGGLVDRILHLQERFLLDADVCLLWSDAHVPRHWKLIQNFLLAPSGSERHRHLHLVKRQGPPAPN